jgi:putative nucleotidyltransferase with HDIG domain
MDILFCLESLLRNLNAAIKSAGMYPPTHPSNARFFGRIVEDLEPILAEQDSLVLGVVDHVLVAQGLPFVGADATAQAFADRLEQRGIGSLGFRRGCRLEEVSQLVQVLALAPDAFKRLGAVKEVLAQRGLKAVWLSHQVPTEEQAEDAAVGGSGLARGLRIYRETVGTAKRILTEARLGKIPSLPEAQAAVLGLVDGILQDRNTMVALTLIKGYDEYLFTHSVNVGVLCTALGHSLGLDGETLRELSLGAFLHDIGKVHWPEGLYLKPRGLSEEEWALVQRHPVDGAEIVSKMGGVSPPTMEIILEHHLRYDRKGYPQIDPGKEASFFGMIGQVADGYDAMTTPRAYQNAFEPAKAVARMQTLAGTVFDPKLLEAFIRMVGVYPVGSLVRLSTGEMALVVKPSSTDSSRPTVRLLFDRTGRPIPEDPEVDLTERDPATGRFRRTIILAIDPATKNFDVSKYLVAQGEAAGASA